MSAGISSEEGSLASKQANKSKQDPLSFCLLEGGSAPPSPPRPAAFLAICSRSSCPPPAKGDPSMPKGLPPFHTLLHVSLDPGFLPLTTPFPSRSWGMGRCQVGVGAPAKEMAAQSSVQVKAQNSHLQREKLGQRESWVNPESWNQWGRCSDVRLRASSSPSTLLLVSQLTPLSSPARIPSLLASLKVLHPFKKVSPAFTEVAN